MAKQNDNMNIRKYLLLTLSHAEKRNIKIEQIIERLASNLKCKAIVISKEKHKNEGFHYHVAIKNEDASKYTYIKKIRDLFPEFDGMQCNVEAKKGWATTCSYITKNDKNPVTWGEYSIEQILEIAEAARNSKKSKTINKEDTKIVFQQLQECDEWIQVYEKEVLRKELIYRYNNIKKIFEDLNTIKKINKTIAENILEFLDKYQQPEEYSIEEIKEKYIVLDWIACQIAFQRPIKTKQLFIYGPPSTQKTLLFHFLAKVLRIYFSSSRRNDFTQANDYYDLWVFDEFHEPDQDNYNLTGATETGTAFANTLLKILDGQECRLDSKYEKVFTKKKNVPIIMIANELPKSIKNSGPMQERFMRICFKNKIENLKEERIIATLWGCIKRRIFRNVQLMDFLKEEGIKQNEEYKYIFDIDYNSKNCKLYSDKREDISSPGKEIEHEIYSLGSDEPFCIRNSPFVEKQHKNKVKLLIIPEVFLLFFKMSLLNFSIIPLKKKEKAEQKTTFFYFFNHKNIGGNFIVHRFLDENKDDFASWPLIMGRIDNLDQDEKEPKIIALQPILYDFSEILGETAANDHLEGKWRILVGPRGIENYTKQIQRMTWDIED